MRIGPALAWLSLTAIACSTSGGRADAGMDAVPDAGTDAGRDAGVIPDHDPTESFALIVPPGTGLCTTFYEGRSWQQEVQAMGWIDLVPGTYILPRAEVPLAADFIGGIVHGPDRATAEPGPTEGTFNVEYYYGAWIYRYREDFTLRAQPYRVEVTVWFEPAHWGLEWPAEATLEGVFASRYLTGLAHLGPGEDPIDEVQAFSACNLGEETFGQDHQGTTQGGDRITAEVRHAGGCLIVGNTGCEALHRAEVWLGGFHQTVINPMRLVYSAGHHNADQKYLLFLDPPHGLVAAVLVLTPADGTVPGGALVRLNAGLQELARHPFTEWQSTGP